MKVILVASVSPEAWLGGLNYYRSLISALGERPADGLDIAVATNRPEAFSDLPTGGLTLLHTVFLGGSNVASRITRFASRWLSVDPQLASLARRSGASLVTHAPANRASPCPVLFWMPDFQHCHLPSFFSAQELRSRDRRVRATRHHGHILLSSKSAERDFRSFYPELAEVKGHVLRFTPQLDEFEHATPESIMRKFDIRGGFFFLPNQFWRHKNHMMVVQALRRLPEHFQVVCTGSFRDHRGDEHVNRLLAEVAAHGLEARFRMLGVVPKAEMLQLMAASSAVINPSLFEGWSTTVEEAKALGKRLVLSNLPVHREQDPPDAIFFDPSSADELAEALRMVLAQYDPGLESTRAMAGRESHRQNRAAFARDYINIANVCRTKQ